MGSMKAGQRQDVDIACSICVQNQIAKEGEGNVDVSIVVDALYTISLINVAIN